MKKLSLLLTAVLLASSLTACSDKSADTSTAIAELPIIDMVATHDIALEISTSQLTFVPNSVAPWLGRIILLDDAGHLYSTDIEGRAPKPISHNGGNGKYIDIFGLARDAAPGVFLAITDQNKIEAFIESDDVGNFSPMIYSGAEVLLQTFCVKRGPVNNEIVVFTQDGKYKTLNLVINEKTIRQETTNQDLSPAQSPNCLLQHAPIAQDAGNYNAVTGNQTGISIFQNDPAEQKFLVSIKNGLSVRGVDHIKYVASTTSNYGGGAYADGVFALVDADENRIVFISLSYAEGQLLEVVNSRAEEAQ